MELLERDSILAALRRVKWRQLGVRWVVLFGSLARKGVGRDVDLLVMPAENGGVRWRLKVAAVVGEAAGVDWSKVDVVEASPHTPCPIIYDAWRWGVIVYEDVRGLAREWLLTRVIVCGDYMVAAERLGVVRAAVEAVRRRWGRGGSS